jgi:putative membrane protein
MDNQQKAPIAPVSLLTFLKGLAMGAADIVPGVSGGTIAFITGIYQPLLDSLSAIDIALFSLWKNKGFAACWKKINGNFLVVLAAGIAISLISFAKITKYLMHNYPPLLWSFFFGLICASLFILKKQIKTWKRSTISLVALGTLLGALVTQIPPVIISIGYLNIFFAGYVAICAMILPGISGSYILLLLGLYRFMLEALLNFELTIITVFISGCFLGLLSFSRFLRWCLAHYHDASIAILGGFMVGSINKVWPWKRAIQFITDSHGKKLPLLEQNLLPQTYTQATGQQNYLFFSILIALFAFVFVMGLDYFTNKKR